MRDREGHRARHRRLLAPSVGQPADFLDEERAERAAGPEERGDGRQFEASFIEPALGYATRRASSGRAWFRLKTQPKLQEYKYSLEFFMKILLLVL